MLVREGIGGFPKSLLQGWKAFELFLVGVLILMALQMQRAGAIHRHEHYPILDPGVCDEDPTCFELHFVNPVAF